MPQRSATLAATGLFLACVAAALTIPSVPLRLGLPSLLLLAAVLVPGRVVDENLRTFILAAIWVWVAGCLLAAPPGAARTAAFGLVAAGLALGLPAAANGLREAGFLSRPLDAGHAVAVLLLALLGLALGLLWPQRIPVRLPALWFVLVVAVLGYLAVREGAGDAATPRRAAAAGLALAAAACLVGPVLWRTASLRASRFESAAAGSAAIAATDEELARARILGLPGAVADALRRRSRLLGGAGEVAARRAALREIAALDPSDRETLRELFRLALDDRPDAREALELFARLPDAVVDPAAAGRMIPRALHAGSWQDLARAWRLSGGRPATESLAASDLAAAGEALYFQGEYRVAADLLRSSLAQLDDWHVRRALVFALLRDERPVEAREVLAGVEHAGHEAEAAWLLGRATVGGARAAGGGGVSFEDVLTLKECRLESPAAAPAGEIAISFAWEVSAPVPPDWRVFVHVRREAYGGFFFQGDHEFAEFGHPSRDLACGSRFGYTVRFAVPGQAPPGDYTVSVGLWDGRDNRRPSPAPPLPAGLMITAGDRVRLEPGLRLALESAVGRSGETSVGGRD